MSSISDKFYLTLSERAYEIDHKQLPSYIMPENNGVKEKWKAIKDTSLVTSDISTAKTEQKFFFMATKKGIKKTKLKPW